MLFIALATFITIVMLCEWFVCSKRLFANSTIYKYTYLTASFLVGYMPIIAILTAANPIENQALTTWAILLVITNLLVKIPLVIYLIFHKKYKKHSVIAKVSYIMYVTLLLLSVAYGASIGRNDIQVNFVTIKSNKIPKSFDGYKIAQFSDTHIGNIVLSNDIFKRLADSINKYNVDLIAQTGDLVNMTHKELNPQIISKLKRLKSKDGVVAVLGNHDLGFYVPSKDMAKEIFDSIRVYQREKLGWRLLENQNFFVHRGGDSIAISGVTYPKNLNHNNINSYFGGSNIEQALRGVNDSVFTVMASHTPSLFDSLAAKPVDLMLSGHVHAMQLKIGKWSPSKFLFEKYSGLYNDGDRQLYVNDGFGFVFYPFRMGAKPEITIFSLKSSN